MASLKRIEDLARRINYAQPSWIEGEWKDSGIHLSGRLRMIANMIEPDVKVEDENGAKYRLAALLDEVAEVLDDAHEEWLNTQLAARDVCGDVDAMRAPIDPLTGENWFGGFTESREINVGSVNQETVIEWPNLEISVTQLAAVLRGKEYKL